MPIIPGIKIERLLLALGITLLIADTVPHPHLSPGLVEHSLTSGTGWIDASRLYCQSCRWGKPLATASQPFSVSLPTPDLEEPPMKPLTSIFLTVSGLLLLAIGSTILFVPHAFYASDGIVLGNNPSLLSEIRAPGGLLADQRTGHPRWGVSFHAAIAGIYADCPRLRILRTIAFGGLVSGWNAVY
jgi:hypothetical protein